MAEEYIEIIDRDARVIYRYELDTQTPIDGYPRPFTEEENAAADLKNAINTQSENANAILANAESDIQTLSALIADAGGVNTPVTDLAKILRRAIRLLTGNTAQVEME